MMRARPPNRIRGLTGMVRESSSWRGSTDTRRVQCHLLGHEAARGRLGRQSGPDQYDRPAIQVEGFDINDAGAAAVIWQGNSIDIGGGVFANYLPAGGTWDAHRTGYVPEWRL